MLIAAFIAYLVAAAAIVGGAYWFIAPATAQGWTTFSQVAGIGFTAVTSLFGSAVSIVTARRQTRAQRELEFLKTQLSEVPKAFLAMRQASNEYYYALAELEAGKLDKKRIKAADLAMQGASIHVGSLAPDKRKAWYDYWQQGRYVSEQAAALADEGERPALWQRYAGDLGKRLRTIQEAAVLEKVETAAGL